MISYLLILLLCALAALAGVFWPFTSTLLRKFLGRH